MYYLRHVSLAVYSKGDSSDQKLIGEDANSPNVYFLVVLIALQHFRGDVQRSSTEGRAKLILAEDSPTEIA